MNEDITKAIKLISNIYVDKNHTPVYRFTNENLSEVVNNMNVKDKNILTVCSSGDHYLNFLLNGAASIDTFDINVFTKYYTDLKIASVLALNYEEFMNFYFSHRSFFDRRNSFDYSTYLKIRNYMKDSDSLCFWDNLFNKLGSLRIYNSMLFMNRFDAKDSVINCNDYLKNKDNYNLLKTKLKNSSLPSFKCIDIFDEYIDIDKKYDLVYLSNILDYVHFENKEDYLEFLDGLVKKMGTFLEDDGELMLSYLFCYMDDYWGSVRDIKFSYLYQTFQLDRNIYKINSFRNGTNTNGNLLKNRDAVVLCKKRVK